MDGVKETIEVAETISEFGIQIVLSAVFIVLMMLMFIVVIKRVEDMSKTNLELNRSLITQIKEQNTKLVDSLMFPETEGSYVDEVDEQAILHKKVEDVLKSGRDALQCERLDVFVFMNGQKVLNGAYRFVKFVKTFSVCKIGTSISELQELPISFFPKMFDELMKEKNVVLDTHKMRGEGDAVACQWVAVSGATFAVLSLIREKGAPFGFISVGYKVKPDDALIPRIKEESAKIALKIGVLVDE